MKPSLPMPECRNLPYKRKKGGILAAAATWLTVCGLAMPTASGQTQPKPTPVTTTASPATIAQLASGQRIEGELLIGDSPGFLPQDSDAPIPWTEIRTLQFPESKADERPSDDLWRVYLAGRQRHEAQLLGISDDSVQLALDSGQQRQVPRWAVAGLARAAGDRLFPRQQAVRDMLLLTAKDELYGRLRRLAAKGAEFRGSFGDLEIPIDRVAGISFAATAAEASTATGITVRVWYAPRIKSSGDDDSANCLVGLLAHVATDRLILHHPQLGQVPIPRSRLQRMEVIHFGARTTLEPGYHHLGNEVRPTFDVTWPESTELETIWNVKALPAGSAWLTLNVIELEHDGPGAKFAQELAAGHLRTSVILNGQTVDYLNRYVTATTSQPQRVRLRLPREKLVAGDNKIVIRQSSQLGESDEYDDCGLYDLAIEIDPAP